MQIVYKHWQRFCVFVDRNHIRCFMKLIIIREQLDRYADLFYYGSFL